MRSATLTKEHFEPRDGFEPTKLRNAARSLRTVADASARLTTDARGRPLRDDEWLERDPATRRRVLVEPASSATRRRGSRSGVTARRAYANDATELGVDRARRRRSGDSPRRARRGWRCRRAAAWTRCSRRTRWIAPAPADRRIERAAVDKRVERPQPQRVTGVAACRPTDRPRTLGPSIGESVRHSERGSSRCASESGGSARTERPRSARAEPSTASPTRLRPTGSVRTKVAPSRGSELTSSVPPCASAIERAMKSPRPVPGFELPGISSAPELLEDARLMLARDPRSGVANRDAHAAVRSERPHLDLAVLR